MGNGHSSEDLLGLELSVAFLSFFLLHSLPLHFSCCPGNFSVLDLRLSSSFLLSIHKQLLLDVWEDEVKEDLLGVRGTVAGTLLVSDNVSNHHHGVVLLDDPDQATRLPFAAFTIYT